ncbi:MAG: EamA family transporter [Ilumatobacteraceae bacterium]
MNRIPLIGISVVSVQLGAAIAASLFDRVGAPGTVLLRQGFAAAVLLAIARPRVVGRGNGDWLVVGLFGLVLAAMNVCFYEAVQRLPLGIAVTIELFGPLGLAAGPSRTARELAYVGLAAIGVVLLGGVTHHVDMAGVAFALCAGAGWASYILLSRRTGRRFEGVEGLALAMVVATVVVAPLGVATGGSRLLEPGALITGLAVAALSAAIPFTLELHALRSVGPRAFGVIMSTSPAVAATIGWLVLAEPLHALQVVAIGCVVSASAATAVAGDVSR